MKERIFKKDPELLFIGKALPSRDTLNATVGSALVMFFTRTGVKFTAGERSYLPRSGDIAVADFCGDEIAVDTGELPEGSVLYMLVSNARLYGDIDLYGSGLRIGTTGDYRGIMEATLRQLMREQSAGLPAGESLKETLLSTVMTLIVRVTPITLRPHLSSNVFFTAKEYLDDNYLSDETLTEICEKLNIDRFYLTHVFKQEIGMPPVKYVINRRMQQARELLETTDLDINVVAKSCGYADPAYFCRVFRNTQGCTALKYRADFKARLAREQREERERALKDQHPNE